MFEDEADLIADAIVASLRNTFKGKRSQFPKGAAAILALRLGHHRLDWGYILHALHERIWPNPVYAWVSGVIRFEPRSGWRPENPPELLDLHLNPNASQQVAHATLTSVFGGGARFHAG